MDMQIDRSRRAMRAWTPRHWIGLAIHVAGATWFLRQAAAALTG